jgi:hypothetical protein
MESPEAGEGEPLPHSAPRPLQVPFVGPPERGLFKAELRMADGTLIRGLADPAGGTFDAAGDFDPLIGRGAGYRLLQAVDPGGGEYGAVFDAAQMDDLLSDIDLAMSRAALPVEQRGLQRLRVMAVRCREEENLCISFTATTTPIPLARSHSDGISWLESLGVLEAPKDRT